MQLRRSPGARPIDSDWHRSRQEARETAYNGNLDQFFSEAEQVKYNLDTAQITGADNPRVFMMNVAIDVFGINGTDVRELKDR